MKMFVRVLALLTAALLMMSVAAAQTLQDDLAELEKKIESMELEIQIAELQLQLTRISGGTIDQIVAQTKLTELETQLKQLQDQRNQLQRGRATELKAQIADLEAQNESLKAQIAANEAVIYSLRSELGAMPGELGGIVRYSATSKGFISEVRTMVELDGTTIVAITVDASGETAVIGGMAAESDYTDQFIGMSIFDAPKADVCTGATYTSRAVLAGLEAIAGCVAAEGKAAAEEDPVTEEIILTGTAKGFAGNVTVTVTLAGDVITSMQVDAPMETVGFGSRYTENKYTGKFVGVNIHEASGVDIISGATITGKAVRSALKQIEDQLEPEAASSDVVLTGSGKGFFGNEVPVTITVDGSGRITSVMIDLSTQMAPNCDLVMNDAFIGQFLGKTGPFTIGQNVDVVTVATFTSNGVIEAINEALGY